jgi:predicted metal-binding membrane protein
MVDSAISAVPERQALTFPESALRDDRSTAVVLFVLLPLVSWTWMAVMAQDIYGPMTGASAWMMTSRWDLSHLLLLWAMWVVMMAGMMLPSATPTFLLYSVVARQRFKQSATRQVYALSIGYLVVWTLFSLGVTALQSILGELLLLSPMMEVTRPAAGATLLIIAGVYQLTPLKHACLRSCQNPLHFLSSRWRPGVYGAFLMGLDHGMYCVGCCWALMLLLFAGGVMNLAVIAALTAFVAFEKLTRFGVAGAMVSGVLLIEVGIRIFVG